MMDLLERDAARIRLKRVGWLSTVHAGFADELLREAQIRRYVPGEYAHHIGDEAGGIYGVTQGSFAVLGNSPSMLGTIMGHVVHVGEWFGEGPLILKIPRMLEYRALEPSSVMYVPLACLNRMATAQGESGQQLMTLVAYNSGVVTRAMADLLIRRADQRLAAVLLRVSGALPEGGHARQAECAISQSEIAEMANVSRHTANAVLQKFQKENWVEIGYRIIRIRDVPALSQYLISSS